MVTGEAGSRGRCSPAWFDHRLENDERSLSRIETARREIRGGQFVTLDALDESPE